MMHLRLSALMPWMCGITALSSLSISTTLDAQETRIIEWVTQVPEHDKGWYHHPAISPDDRFTAISVGASGFSENTIWIHDSHTRKLTQLTTHDPTMIWGDVMVRWSPMGDLLAFASDRGGEQHLYTIQPQGGPLTKITSNPLPHGTWNCRFSFSPDGTKILYSDGDEGGHNFFTFDLDNGHIEQITHFSGRALMAPDWSSDGESIVFSSDDKFYIWDVTRKTETLVETDKNGEYPTWSPDAQWIGFQENEHGYWRTYLVHRTGGPSVRVGPGAEYHSQVPSWSNDGKHIIYHGVKASGMPIIVRSMADASEKTLMDSVNPVGWRWGSWSPDARYLAFMHADFQNGTLETSLMMGEIERGVITAIGQVDPHPSNALRQAPVWYADSERFLMIEGDSTRSQIVALNITDLSSETLTTIPGRKCEAALSPDEELIAFIVEANSVMDLWLLDLVTDEEMQLTFSGREKSQLRFSPDGSQVAFIQQNPMTKYDIMVISVDGGAPRQVSTHEEWELDPMWLGNDRISYTLHPAGAHRSLAYGSIDDEATRNVISSPKSHLVLPAWSIDGKQLFYQDGWPQGPFMRYEPSTGHAVELISNAQQFLLSGNKSRIAYLDPTEAPLHFLWRENVEHIVSANRLP